MASATARTADDRVSRNPLVSADRYRGRDCMGTRAMPTSDGMTPHLANCETDVINGRETCVRVGARTRSQRGHRDSLCPIGVVVSSQDRCEIIALQRREQSPGPAAAVPLSGAKQKPTAVGPAQLLVLKRDNLGPRYRIGDAGVASNVVGAPGAAQAATRADARQGPGRQSCLSSARRSGRSAWSNELRLSVCALLRRLLECR